MPYIIIIIIISHAYAVSNVMSPLLLNLYVQDLIECLDRKGL